jgi:hypothetical protein
MPALMIRMRAHLSEGRKPSAKALIDVENGTALLATIFSCLAAKACGTR